MKFGVLIGALSVAAVLALSGCPKENTVYDESQKPGNTQQVPAQGAAPATGDTSGTAAPAGDASGGTTAPSGGATTPPAGGG